MKIDLGSEDTSNIYFEINENTEDVNETTDSSNTANIKTEMDSGNNFVEFNTDMGSDDTSNIHFKMNENTDVNETTDSSYIANIKTEVDTENNFVELNTDNILEMFPFVCGVCDMKFNSISIYLTHFQMHTHVDKYLHCCIQVDIGKESEHSDLFSCGVCWLRYPSLCTLYKHLVEDEGIQDFSFNGSKRTAHFLFDQSKSEECSSHVEHTNKVVNECSEECKIEAVDSMDTVSVYNTKQEDDIAERKKIFVPKRPPKRRIMSKTKQNESREKHKSTEDSGLLSQAESVIRNAEDVINKQKAVKQFSEDETENKIDKLMSSRKREQCDISGKEFTKANNRRHTKKHKDVDKGLSCIVCGKVFTKNFNLKLHIDAVHEEVKNHKCEVCDRVFSYMWQVIHHKSKEHGMGKRWTCERCRKIFFLRGNFKAHVKICSEVPQERVMCTMCGKTFKNDDSLRNHTWNVHTTKENCICGVCGMSFSRRSNLDRHIKAKKHKES